MVEPSRPGLVAASPDAPSPVMFFGQVAAGDQVEQAFDLGDGAMWAFYRQPSPAAPSRLALVHRRVPLSVQETYHSRTEATCF